MLERNHISIIFIIYFGLLISNSHCQTKKTSEMIKIPKVTNEFEKLKFNENYDATKGKSSFTLSDGTYVELEKESYGYIERRWDPDSYFIIIKQYYENRTIKEKGVIFNYGYFETGNWYYFNEDGQLIETVNYDQNFAFTFQKLFNFLQQKKINLTLGHIKLYSGYHTSIEKRSDSNKHLWVVTWLKEPQLAEEILFDGNTGNVIKTNEIIINE